LRPKKPRKFVSSVHNETTVPPRAPLRREGLKTGHTKGRKGTPGSRTKRDSLGHLWSVRRKFSSLKLKGARRPRILRGQGPLLGNERLVEGEYRREPCSGMIWARMDFARKPRRKLKRELMNTGWAQSGRHILNTLERRNHLMGRCRFGGSRMPVVHCTHKGKGGRGSDRASALLPRGEKKGNRVGNAAQMRAQIWNK